MREPTDDTAVSAAFLANFFSVSTDAIRGWAKAGLIPAPARLGTRTLRWRWGDVKIRVLAAAPNGDVFLQPLAEIVDVVRKLEEVEDKVRHELSTDHAARRNLPGVIDDARLILDRLERFARREEIRHAD